MKKLFFILIGFVILLGVPNSAIGQNGYEDVVYLKNGGIVHGMIIEQVPNQSIKIQTSEGVIFIYQMDDILKITKESVSNPRVVSAKPGKPQKKFMGFYMGVDFTNLKPDGQMFSDDLSDALNGDSINPGDFSGFSFTPYSKTGFAGGITLYQRISRSLFLQTELTYSMKGFVMKGSGFYYYQGSTYSVSIEESFRLNYLKIPLYAKYYFFPKGDNINDHNNFNAYLQAGPAIGLAIVKKINTIATISGQSNEDSQTYDGFNTIDFSLDFGGGLEFYKVMYLEFRYDLGLTNVLSEDAQEDAILKNRGFMIALGYTFPL